MKLKQICCAHYCELASATVIGYWVAQQGFFLFVVFTGVSSSFLGLFFNRLLAAQRVCFFVVFEGFLLVSAAVFNRLLATAIGFFLCDFHGFSRSFLFEAGFISEWR